MCHCITTQQSSVAACYFCAHPRRDSGLPLDSTTPVSYRTNIQCERIYNLNNCSSKRPSRMISYDDFYQCLGGKLANFNLSQPRPLDVPV